MTNHSTTQTDQPRDHYYKTNFPPHQAHEIFLVTDGSGHIDGYTGSAAVWFSPKHKFFNAVTGGWNGGSVDRSEFQALLAGLHGITTWLLNNGYTEQNLTAKPLLLHWTNDRESLVLAVARDPETGQPFYKRNSNRDLWAHLAYYERFFLITPMRRNRNTTPLMSICDVLAGQHRAMMLAHSSDLDVIFNMAANWLSYWDSPDLINKETIAHKLAVLQAKATGEEPPTVNPELGKNVVSMINSITTDTNLWKGKTDTNNLFIPS